MEYNKVKFTKPSSKRKRWYNKIKLPYRIHLGDLFKAFIYSLVALILIIGAVACILSPWLTNEEVTIVNYIAPGAFVAIILGWGTAIIYNEL